jgi:CRISPR-associated exonuclease Cas4
MGPPYPEVPISALEHFSYCPRQCALIHVEQTFEENVYTVRGRLAHERVHSEDDTSSRGVKVVRGVPLWSEALGLRGRADAVELRDDGPYPIEYKVGAKIEIHAHLQLCAQAFCLEEMLGALVLSGAIYSRAMRRRREVVFDRELRAATLGAIEGVREQLMRQELPPAPNDARCPKCSLIMACLPHVVGESARLRGIQGTLFQAW